MECLRTGRKFRERERENCQIGERGGRKQFFSIIQAFNELRSHSFWPLPDGVYFLGKLTRTLVAPFKSGP